MLVSGICAVAVGRLNAQITQAAAGGELRQRYREGQEDHLGALGLVLNAVVLRAPRYTDAALTQRRA